MTTHDLLLQYQEKKKVTECLSNMANIEWEFLTNDSEKTAYYDIFFKDIISIDFPIYSKLNYTNDNREVLSWILSNTASKESGKIWILPYFLGSSFWCQVAIENYDEFILQIIPLLSSYSLCLINIQTDTIIDIELNEDNFEMRMLNNHKLI